MNKFLRYSLLIPGWTLAAIVAIVILAALLIQTRPVKKKLAAFVEQQASNYINGQLSIGKIDGNFFSHLVLNDLLLTVQNDTIASVARVEVRYNLWPLIDGKLQIYTAQIDRPGLHLKQLNDSTWNIQQIIRPVPEEKADTVDAPGRFSFELAAFELTEGALRIESPDTLIPRGADHINAGLSFFWANDEQQVLMDHFSLSTRHPDLELKQFTFQLKRNTERIELTDLRIRTAKNQLKGTIEYAQKEDGKSMANLQSEPLEISEFDFFLPGLTLPAAPVLKLDASCLHDSLYATLDLTDQDQRIHLELASPNFAGLLYDPEDSVVRYRLQGDLEHIDLAYWLGKPELKYLINGHLTAEGTGIDRRTAIANLSGRLSESLIADRPLDRLHFNFSLNKGNLDGMAEGQGDFGSFHIKPQIRDLNGQPTYRFDLVTKKIDLAQLTGIDSLRSSINLQANVRGRGFNIKSLSAKAVINMTESRLRQVHLDTLFANIQYGNENIQLDSVWLKTRNFSIGAAGNYSLRSNSDIRLTARFDGIDEFTSFLPVDSIQTSGTVRGHLTGIKDSLNLLASVELDESHYQDFSFSGLRMDANARLTPADTIVHANLLIKNPGNGSFMLNSLSAVIEASPDSVLLDAQLTGEDLNSRIRTSILPREKLKFMLTEWLINYKNEHWALQQAPAVIEIDSVNYYVNHFKIASGDSDSSQYVTAQGTISRIGDEDFQLKIANIHLAWLTELLQMETKASGLLNLNLNLNGPAGSPLIKGDFGLRQAVFNDYALTKLEGTVNYQDNRLKTEVQVVPRDSGEIAFTGTIPLQLHLDSMNFNFDPKDSVDALLIVERFPLTALNAIVMADEIKGLMNGRVTVKGTVDSPNLSGDLGMRNGSFKMAKYGIDYRDIGFNMQFLPEKITLDTFLIKTADGQMMATGQTDFNSAFYTGDISQSKIAVQFNKFNPFNHDQFNMQLSGDAGLSGEKGKAVFDGNLNIPQSEIYLPAVLRMLGKMNTYEIPEPILVKELKGMSAQSDTIILLRTEAKQDSTGPGYFDRFTGKIKLRIPRNTWIKSEDMHIELSGDLELIKHKDFFEIFGTVDVVRGQYDLLGKTFVIDEGTIRFQGGEDLNPGLDIKASYSFRTSERIEQELTVKVSGTAESPAVSFSMDDESVNEGDALSYILFGKGMNELSTDQHSNLSGSGGGSLAGNAAATLISSQISGFLGNKLNMDYLEIKSEDGFENATVVVGKYITNDLFVSYEQRFGGRNEKDDLATYEVKLEYELFKFLFLQLNNSSVDSGFDVIFKLDSK